MYQTTKKRASGPKCPVTGKRIQGVCFLLIDSSYCPTMILHLIYVSIAVAVAVVVISS